MADTNPLLSRMDFAAAIVASVTYGAYAVLASICIHYLIKRGKGKRLRNNVFLIYTVVMLISGTIWFVVGTYWSSLEFVGPTSVDPELLEGGNPHLAILKDTLLILNVWLADSMITYRLYIIWGSSIVVVIIPCLLWLSTVGVGITLLVTTAKPAASFFGNLIINLQTAFFCLSISLNIICTVLIAGMIWYRQWHLRQLASPGLHAIPPTFNGAIAIIVESAALYSVVGIIVIPTVVRQLPLQSVMVTLIGTVTCIAPTLIVLRLALGVAENPARTRTRLTMTTMAFVKSSVETGVRSGSATVGGSGLGGSKTEKGNCSELSFSAAGGGSTKESV